MLQGRASGKNLSSLIIDRFSGLNRTDKGMRGEMESMTNMCSDKYPCASAALSREVIATYDNVQAAVAPLGDLTGFTGIAGGSFYYNGAKKSGNTVLGADYEWKIVIYVNTYILYGISSNNKRCFIYTYNVDADEFNAAGTTMDKLIVTAGMDSNGNYLATIQYRYSYVDDYTVTDREGNVIKNSDFFDKYFNYGDTAPSGNFFEDYFKVGDEVSISGFPSREDNVGQVWFYSTTHETVTPQSTASYNENNTLDTDAYASLDEVSSWQVTEAVVKGFNSVQRTVQHQTTYVHYIYFDLYNKNGDETDFLETQGASGDFYVSGVMLTNKRRSYSDICLHQGRLWGTTVLGKNIYGSASDNLFSVTASDINAGYAARLQSDRWGKYTGLCSYKGYLIAFKQDAIELVYGNAVANYKLETAIDGVGCIDKRSIAITPNGVIFLGAKGFYIYNLSTPRLISAKLNTLYTAAVGAFDGACYFVSATDGNSVTELLVYDTRYDVWHRRDDYNAKALFRHRDKMYFVSEPEANSADSVLSAETETPDEWAFATVKDNSDTLDNKAISELWIYADAANGTEFTVYTAADNGEYTKHSTFTGTGGLALYRCPVRIELCTFFRIKMTGSGGIVIHEIEAKTAKNNGRRVKERVGTELPELAAINERIDYA